MLLLLDDVDEVHHEAEAEMRGSVVGGTLTSRVDANHKGDAILLLFHPSRIPEQEKLILRCQKTAKEIRVEYYKLQRLKRSVFDHSVFSTCLCHSALANAKFRANLPRFQDTRSTSASKYTEREVTERQDQEDENNKYRIYQC